jgi:hypothetical protein
MKKAILILALAIAASPIAAAGSLTLSFNAFATDHLFQTKDASSDQIYQLGFSWEKPWAAFSLFAGGEYTGLARNTGLNDVHLSAGLDRLFALGDKTALYLAFGGEGRIYRAEYADFNQATIRFDAALKTYLGPSSILKATARSEYKSYKLSPFDRFTQTLLASVDKYFESKTTLKAEIGWGFEYFPHPWAASETMVDGTGMASGLADLGATDIAFTGGSPGPGSGGSSSGNSGNAGGGRTGASGGAGAGGFGYGETGNGMPGSGYKGGGQGARGSLFTSSSSSSGSGSSPLQIASLSGLLAQGIGDSFGLRLSATRQWRLSGTNPFTSVEEYYLVENPTSDAFSWQGYGAGVQATAELPWDINLKLGYTIIDKEFPGIAAYALDGSPLGSTRRDKRGTLELRLEKTFARFGVFLAASSVRNDSNDPLFAWKGYSLLGGLTWTPFTGAGN